MRLRTLYTSSAAIATLLVLSGIIASYAQVTILTALNFFCFAPLLIFFSGGAFFTRWHIKAEEQAELEAELQHLRKRVGKQ